jgi:hypothetical protein
MDDLERRLRAAMSGAASPPPAGLMAGIRRRHRRHLIRVVAGVAAALAVLALVAPPAAHALRSAVRGQGPAVSGLSTASPCPSRFPDSFGCSRYVGPAGTASPQVCPVFCGPPASSGHAAAGTMLRDCQSGNGGSQEILGYRARSVRAGPVWFVWARTRNRHWSPGQALGHGQLQAGAGPVAVQAGATVVVRVAPAARSRFQFLRTFDNTDRYRLGAGLDGITFAACPASYLGPVTVFWVGYLDSGLSCIPLEVSVAGRRPVRVGLSDHGGTCAAA